MKWSVLATSVAIAGAALAGLTVVTDRVAAAREARAEAAYPPEGEFVDVGGRRVHAVIAGEGPDLVLLHGANGTLREFTFHLVERLAERYRVIALDRPGLGYTDRTDPSYRRAFAGDAESPAEQAALLAAAAQKLGAERPIVLGHSFGGIVGFAWALDQPLAALVSVAGVANPWPGDLGWIYTVNGTSLGGALVVPAITAYTPPARLEAAVESVFAPQAPPEGYSEHIGPALAMRREAFRANARQVNTLRPHVVEMVKRYGEIGVPVEIIHGSADTSVPLRVHSITLPQQIPGAQLTVLDGVGHMPHHTHADEVIAAIDRAATRAGLR